MRVTKIEGQNAFAPAQRFAYMTDGQNMRDQITSE